MSTKIMQNNANNPLVSILIYNYDGQYLKQCLDSIFQQDVLTDLEIILIDDATQDSSWETVLEYTANYHTVMTASRNRYSLGPLYNKYYCERMAQGRYCVLLTRNHTFLPEYTRDCINTMMVDPYAKFAMVERNPKVHIEPTTIFREPLVSLLCYNYNYGRYLRQCLESAFAQTYKNIEVCFSDNASTDESWSIALEFARKYPGKMRLTRNRMNFGPDYNFANCKQTMLGKYFVNFCTDDAIAPDYVERCVNVLEANPNVGFVLVNRSIIDEHGNVTEETPFYNQSCVIPGEEQAAVYMMAGVNPCVTQIMYRADNVDKRSATKVLGARYYGTRILDFNISLDYDVAFLKEPLVFNRIHSQSDTSQADSSLMPVIGLYVLNHQFADTASLRNLRKVTDRLPQSIDKLASLSVRYCLRLLLSGNEQSALKYFHLSMALNPEIANDVSWKKMQSYWNANGEEKDSILRELKNCDNLATRTISYDPPSGSVPL